MCIEVIVCNASVVFLRHSVYYSLFVKYTVYISELQLNEFIAVTELELECSNELCYIGRLFSDVRWQL